MKEKIYWMAKEMSCCIIATSIIGIILLTISDTQAKLYPDGFPFVSWWKYFLAIIVAGVGSFLFFVFEKLEKREKWEKRKIKIECQCGSWFEELITDQDRLVGGRNTICPFCGSIMWVSFGRKEKYITFFKKKGGEYKEYENFC